MVVPSAGGGSSSITATFTVQPKANGHAAHSRVKIGGFSAGTGSQHNLKKPLSVHKADPLDLSTVERRGQSSQKAEITKAVRPYGLQEAPTYRPTEEEWKDPMEYIRKIAPEGRKYGIVKIIPPEAWNPPFAIDTEKFHFRTRKQELQSVEGGNRANLNYLDQLAKFHRQHGTNLTRFPSVDKRPLDLYKLKKAVETRGGFDRVCKGKKWAEIGRDLGYSGKIMSSLSTSLKNSYQKWLHPYEEYLKVAKPGVHQLLEYENGGPFTPSPAPSPMKKVTPSAAGADSPALRASAALNAKIRDSSATPSEPAPPRTSSGFTAVNAGGFTAVNVPPTSTPAQSASFSAINSLNGNQREGETGQSSPQRLGDSPMTSTKGTPNLQPSGLGGNPLANSQAFNHLKRQLSNDAEGGTTNGTESDGAGRRSKRLKKEPAPTVTGSQMTQPRLSTPRTRLPKDRTNYKPGDSCEACGKADDPGSILLCDSCDCGYHKQCLEPPLKSIPDSDWHCPKCLVGTGEYGFEEGGVYSLKEFQTRADNFKENYFANKTPFDPILNRKKPVTEDDVEREFWRLVESLTETVEVEYGADIHSTTHGSGFPTLEKHPRDLYSVDKWNLNVLPLHQESLFRYIKSNISGMTSPWLYVGMCFSTFCWHTEDHYTYSANYQHFGATKTWYGIPSDDALKFEDAMREAVPDLFETQPDLLFQLVTLLPPDKLRKVGVRVYAIDQRAGQLVITFPQAYHAGFNHGFNFNEAVNFTPDDWEPYGADAVQRLQDFRRSPCFSHDELLHTAATRDGNTSIKVARWLAPALKKMRGKELRLRENFTVSYRQHKATGAMEVDSEAQEEQPSQDDIPYEEDEEDFPEDGYVCTFCKAYTYLSRFLCKKSNKIMCLLHAGSFQCCGASEDHRCTMASGDHVLYYRLTDEALGQTLQKVEEKARVPEAWKERLDKLLEEEEKPQLRALRQLLNEGEKIPWELPDLPVLKKFVERCQDWVEEATNYTTRKQQNRRKNERIWRKSSSARQAELEERDREHRKLDNITRLLRKADDLNFDCPEIVTLRERADSIAAFQRNANDMLTKYVYKPVQELDDLLEEGKAFNVDIPEVEKLEKVIQQVKWYNRGAEIRKQLPTLKELTDFLQQGHDLGISEGDLTFLHFQELKTQGELWEAKAKELMSVENVHYQQLDALSKQAGTLPVSPDTLAQVDAILKKQRDAADLIQSLYERSKDPDFRQRPRYEEVREAMKAINELNSKPAGTIDLEKEQKRHEDWMRRGKKLFGKANAPLHILLSHMRYVEQRNEACFDLRDQPRNPVEPASREQTPIEDGENADGSGSSRDVFCICRKPEAGMMIECESCHEWYHGKCLKIARGKVKEDDKYTCPICDWRVKIPRDASRPKLEDLQAWQDEILSLPFQPEEEECLENIIRQASEFRQYISSYINPMLSNPEELTTQRFYLRKLEGAEILLTNETNFFRKELHRFFPVAPNPPPMIEESLSTRKPRPTKLQKTMALLGVDNPDDLPPNLRPRHHGKQRKAAEPKTPQQPIQPAPEPSTTPPGLPPRHLQTLFSDLGISTGVSRPEPGPSFTFADAPMTSALSNSPMFATSSMFKPTATRGHSPPPFTTSSAGSGNLDSSLFESSSFKHSDASGPLQGSLFASASGPSNIDSLFKDLTNDDSGAGTSHAEEALAVTASAREEDTNPDDDKHLMDQFVNTGS